MENKKKMRFAICGIKHETNTFSTLRTRLEDVRVLHSEEMIQEKFWSSFEEV